MCCMWKLLNHHEVKVLFERHKVLQVHQGLQVGLAPTVILPSPVAASSDELLLEDVHQLDVLPILQEHISVIGKEEKDVNTWRASEMASNSRMQPGRAVDCWLITARSGGRPLSRRSSLTAAAGEKGSLPLRLMCSCSSVRPSMTAWYKRRLLPSDATNRALGELLLEPSVELRREAIDNRERRSNEHTWAAALAAKPPWSRQRARES
jgi:hypothetical protein